MSRRASALAMIVVSGITVAACRAPAPMTPAPVTAGASGYCWWAVYRSALPADTVAARFARAYESVGLAGARWSHLGDTAWAQAGPTVLGGVHDGGMYTARMVAYQRGDSAHFRPYVSVAAPVEGWAKGDSAGTHGEDGATGRQLLGLCADLGRAAHVQGVAPRDPDGEEQSTVWRHRP